MKMKPRCNACNKKKADVYLKGLKKTFMCAACYYETKGFLEAANGATTSD